METLRELVDIFHRSRIAPSELLGQQTKLLQLYLGVENGQYASDREACSGIYGQEGWGNYLKLKHGLKNKLLQALFLLDSSRERTNPFERAYYTCYRDFTAAKILLRLGKRQIAMELLRRTLHKARQFELTPIVLESLLAMRHHQGVILGNWTSASEIDAEVRRTLFQYEAEIRADFFLEELLALYLRDRGGMRRQILEKSAAALQSLDPAVETFPSWKLLHRVQHIRVIQSMCLPDYARTAELCREALDLFRRGPQYSLPVLRTYLFQWVVCDIRLKNFEEGARLIAELVSMTETGSSNWFKAAELHCLLAMHAGDYQRAYRVWREVAGHPSYARLYPQNRESWNILQAYLQFLTLIGRIQPEQGGRLKMAGFRIARFLNEVPQFSRDKRGYNIPILVVQILFLLNQQQYDQAATRIEALQRYGARYLRKGEADRSALFIRMLVVLALTGFQYDKARQRGRMWLDKIKNHPLERSLEAHEVELIPYEALWEMALEQLSFGKARFA